YGMAATMHVGKGRRILGDPKLIEILVEPLEKDEQEQYLDSLPQLNAETLEQEHRCVVCWNCRKHGEDDLIYRQYGDRLLRLFRKFRFPPRAYERVVRQSEKPMLQEAIRLLESDGSGENETRERRLLEGRFRMSLREFVSLEEGLAADLCALDEVRTELWTAHESLAIEIAQKQRKPDEVTVKSAMIGLMKAAETYNYKRGYSFALYAQWWIRDAIRKRKGKPD